MNELEHRLEAAFERYNQAALSGSEPTVALFIEALGAEGLRLSFLKVEDSLTLRAPDAGRGRDALPRLRRPARFRPRGSVG